MFTWQRALVSTAYLTVYQVYSWIRRRDPEILDYQYWSSISDHVIEELNDVIAGKADPISKSVEPLLQLLDALEPGRIKAIGRLNCTPGSESLPRPLPKHYWTGFTFINRTPSGCDYSSRQTCAALKREPKGRFWCDLLFERRTVLKVWPPFANLSPAGAEHVSALGKTSGHDESGASHELRKRNRKLRLASQSIIHDTITEVYDEFEKMNEKPPNLREIVAPVRDKLKAHGYEASGRRIQNLANADKHKNRRRKPGTTILSENKRRQRH